MREREIVLTQIPQIAIMDSSKTFVVAPFSFDGAGW